MCCRLTTHRITCRNLPDQVDSVAAGQPVAASGGPRPATTAGPSGRAAAGAPELSNIALSKSDTIWNCAYEDLETTEPELVGSYLHALSQVLGDETGDETGDSSPTALLDRMHDPILRQHFMKEMVQKGQEKTLSASKITTRVGEIADFVLGSKGIVDLTIQSVPQAAPAALPWAGVCFGLEMLRKPAQATKSNLEGIAHVISRMDWYCALTDLLLDKTNVSTKYNFREVLGQLETTITKLYRALLLYQMKSVCSYYRHQGARFLHDIVSSNDWEGDINIIKQAETTLRGDIDQYYQEQTKASLNKLTDNSSKLLNLLGNIRQDIQSFILQQKVATRDQIESDCRKDLRVVDPEDDMKRIENNKDELLDDAYRWIFDTPEYMMFTNWEHGEFRSPQRRVLWLKGHAGTGKTMLMIGLIRHFSKQSAALAPGLSFFFCQATDTKLNNATAVLRSLIWLLLLQQPRLISHLLQKYKDSGASLFNERNAFYALSTVFENMLSDQRLSPVYLAVDALDECSEGRADLIKLIFSTLGLSQKVRWLLSSRPEIDLAGLESDITLVELDTQRLEVPVKAYIKHKLRALEGKEGYTNSILEEVSDIVYERAENTFLWVALAFKALGEEHGEYSVEIISDMPPGLSDLYQHMMARIEKTYGRKPRDCKKILKTAFLAFRPLRLSELSLITGLSPGLTRNAVKECGSFVSLNRQTINLIHQSAKDYLREKYATVLDPAGAAQGHIDIVKHCLSAISSLEQNMYKLDLGFKPETMTPPNPDPLASLQYSCVSWIDHVRSLEHEKPESIQTVLAEVSKYLKKGFLRWLESLSLLGEVDEGVLLLKSLLHFVEFQMDADLSLIDFLRDADKFLVRNRTIIERAPLQTYGSALVFSPTSSKVRSRYWHERLPLVEVLSGAEENWGAHQMTLEGHEDWINTITYSSDGKTLASGSDNGIIRLWDAATGTPRRAFQANEHQLRNLAFLQDDKTLASYSKFGIISFWDVAAGVCRSMPVEDMEALSSDDEAAASVLNGKAMQLWNTTTGVLKKAIKTPNGGILAVVFSPNYGMIAVSSYDERIRLWDVATGECQQTLEGRTDQMVFSPKSDMLASTSLNNIVSIWDLTATPPSCKIVGERSLCVNGMAFSPKGDMLALASSDCSVRLWDITIPLPNGKTLEGHTEIICSMSFSPNGTILASASREGTIRLWDMATSLPSSKALEGHTSSIWSMTFSPDGTVLASASIDRTVRLWDVTNLLPNNRDSNAHKITYITDLAFSANGTKLVTISDFDTVRLWDMTTIPLNCEVSQEFKHHRISGVLFFDGRTLVLRSSEEKILIWHFTAMPSNIITLEGHPDECPIVSFSLDSLVLQSSSYSGEVKRLDVVTGDCFQTMNNHVWFSNHGQNSGVGYGLNDYSEWVTLGDTNVLWLPVDYRGCGAVHGSTVAIGTEAGRLVVIRFT
ncbi:WD40-repeat-containing domain protein [Xylaria sp. FL0043]|nr:WD40-repeat-containing domain protein [Xylaria sp. FL0043]